MEGRIAAEAGVKYCVSSNLVCGTLEVSVGERACEFLISTDNAIHCSRCNVPITPEDANASPLTTLMSRLVLVTPPLPLVQGEEWRTDSYSASSIREELLELFPNFGHVYP